MDIIKTSLVSVVIGTVTIAGGLLLNDAKKPQWCNIQLTDVNNENIIPKLQEALTKIDLPKDPVQVGCELKEVEISNGLFTKTKALEFTDKNCQNKSVEDYATLKTDTLKKVLELDKMTDIEEIKTVQKNFENIWNFELFRKCGLIQK